MQHNWGTIRASRTGEACCLTRLAALAFKCKLSLRNSNNCFRLFNDSSSFQTPAKGKQFTLLARAGRQVRFSSYGILFCSDDTCKHIIISGHVHLDYLVYLNGANICFLWYLRIVLFHCLNQTWLNGRKKTDAPLLYCCESKYSTKCYIIPSFFSLSTNPYCLM